MNNRILKHKKLAYAAIVLILLLVWQITSMIIGKDFILPSPVDCLVKFPSLLISDGFVKTCLYSFSHILLGFLIALATGALLALLSAKSIWIKTLLAPIIGVIKAVPVVSFIIFALLLIQSNYLSVLISAIIVFPIVYTNLLSSIETMDPKLLEMAKVYRLSSQKRIGVLWMQQIKYPLITSIKTGIGLAFKSGIAAELIGIPSGSIGEKLYQAKIYLETPDLFCWTLIIIGLSVLSEKVITHIVKKIYTIRETKA